MAPSKPLWTRFFLSLGLLLAISDLHAHGNDLKQHEGQQAGSEAIFDFVENKGQWVSEIRFKTQVPGGAMFLTDKGFAYSYASLEDLERLHGSTSGANDDSSSEQDRHPGQGDVYGAMIRNHAYKVNFVNPQQHIPYRTGDKRPYYHNYFLGDNPDSWKGNVGVYASVVQEHIFPGISVSVYSKGASLKYDFVVSPRADPGLIKLAFDGVNPILTSEGNLRIRTTVNEIIEEAPYAYQVIEGTTLPVGCRYRLTGNVLSFEITTGYNPDYPLVIDPSVVFSTFSGSNGDHYGISSAYDLDGNMFAGSQSRSTGWPATIGAFQTTYGGGFDASVNKYNASGTALIFSTYYGGSNVESPHALIANDAGELIIVGTTQSANLPTPAGAYDRTLGGSSDLFVAHFSQTGGTLIGATYVGGSNGEGLYYTVSSTLGYNYGAHWVSPLDVALDDSGHIWVVSNTESANFPVTAGAQQTTYGGGNTDAVLFRLNPTCTGLRYSTFLGGNKKDIGFGITRNHQSRIVVCGASDSPNFPTTLGAYRTSLTGTDADAFVSILNPVTGFITRSTYLGTDSMELGFKVAVDPLDNVYVAGRTRGNYPISPGVVSMAGNRDLFLEKLAPDLSSSIVSTRFGHTISFNDRFAPTAFMVDNCGNIYLSGYRWNNGSGFPVTTNSFQSTNGRFWFCVLEPDFASLKFATFYGGTSNSFHIHEGVHRFDPRGIAYHSMCADNNSSFPTTPGSFRTTPGNAATQQRQDMASFKFDLGEYTRTDTVYLSLRDTAVCAGNMLQLSIDRPGAEGFVWNTGAATRSVRADTSGVYFVHYWVKGQFCNVFLDSFRVAFIKMPELISVQADSAGCPGEDKGKIRVSVAAGNNIRYKYSWYNKLDSSLLLQVDSDTGAVLSDLGPGEYYVRIVTASNCDTFISFMVPGALAPEASFTISDSVICVGSYITCVNTSAGVFDTWIWNPGNGDNPSLAYKPRFSYPMSGRYGISLVVRNSFCTDTAMAYVTVKDFSLQLTASASPIKYGETVTLETSASEPYTVYRWESESLFSDQQAYSQQVNPDSNSYNVVKVFGRSAYGCMDSAMTVVVVEGAVEVIPELNTVADMPTAFSPNGDGRNDYFRPSVSARAEMRILFFEIFDRWGGQVWHERGVNGLKGWDGTRKGIPAGIGVYFYAIEMEDKWGRRIRYQGDLTLVR